MVSYKTDVWCNLSCLWQTYYCLSTNEKLLVSWQFCGPYGVTKYGYGSGWRKDVVNQYLESQYALVACDSQRVTSLFLAVVKYPPKWCTFSTKTRTAIKINEQKTTISSQQWCWNRLKSSWPVSTWWSDHVCVCIYVCVRVCARVCVCVCVTD